MSNEKREESIVERYQRLLEDERSSENDNELSTLRTDLLKELNINATEIGEQMEALKKKIFTFERLLELKPNDKKFEEALEIARLLLRDLRSQLYANAKADEVETVCVPSTPTPVKPTTTTAIDMNDPSIQDYIAFAKKHTGMDNKNEFVNGFAQPKLNPDGHLVLSFPNAKSSIDYYMEQAAKGLSFKVYHYNENNEKILVAESDGKNLYHMTTQPDGTIEKGPVFKPGETTFELPTVNAPDDDDALSPPPSMHK